MKRLLVNSIISFSGAIITLIISIFGLIFKSYFQNTVMYLALFWRDVFWACQTQFFLQDLATLVFPESNVWDFPKTTGLIGDSEREHTK